MSGITAIINWLIKRLGNDTKTLLKNAGVPKIRGLIPSIEKQQFELYKWVHESLNKQYEKVNQLEKLNVDLIEQNKQLGERAAEFERKYLEERKMVGAEKDRRNGMNTQMSGLLIKNGELESELWIVRNRANNQEKLMAKWKTNYAISDSEHTII